MAETRIRTSEKLRLARAWFAVTANGEADKLNVTTVLRVLSIFWRRARMHV